MKKKAFTLAEILIVVTLVGVIAVLVIRNSTYLVNRTANGKMTYSAYSMLKRAVGSIIATEETGQILPSTLCTKLSDLLNPEGDVNCALIATDYTEFGKATPNFTLKNGMKFYNLGNVAADGVYTVYIDIDGNYRKGIYDDDVQKFIINVNGEVLPDKSSKAANDINYLSAGYKYYDETNAKWVWVKTVATFKDAICSSGISLQNSNYCSGEGKDTNCTLNQCEFILHKN